MNMKEKLQELAETARKRIQEADAPDKLNEVKVAYLGKKGELTAILKGMKDVAPEERPKVGQLVNETRAKIEELLEETKKNLEEAVREEKMKAEVIDITLPAKKARIGHRTVVIIAQRISTIMNADRILVMNKGKVVGFGSHEQLLENCEIYREIYSSQMGGVPVNG